MKSPFPRFRIRELSHLQLQSAVTGVLKAAKPAVVACITMNQQILSLETNLPKHEKSLTRVQANDITPLVTTADTKRDHGSKQFFNKVKVLTTDIDDETAADAQAIYRPIVQQGGVKLIRKPFAEQSAGTQIIITELSTPEMKAKMDRLGVLKDFERMVALNKQFVDLWQTRVSSGSLAQEYPEMKDSRRALDSTLRGLIDNIEFLYLEKHPIITDLLYTTIRAIIVDLDSTVESRATADLKAKAAVELELQLS